MRLSIIIPCYNEEKNIPLILKRFKRVIIKEDIEVIMVNNGSTDNSAAILDKLLPLYTFAKGIWVPKNQGYGYGIVQGLKAAEGEFIGWTHADMQTDPADVIKAYRILEKNQWNEKIYVKGNRKGRKLMDQFFTSGMSIFETLYLRQKLTDVNAQPNIFSKKFFNSWEKPPEDFALDLYALYLAHQRNLNVIRFAVQFSPRIHGTSHWNTGIDAKWKFIKRTFCYSIKMKKAGIR